MFANHPSHTCIPLIFLPNCPFFHLNFCSLIIISWQFQIFLFLLSKFSCFVESLSQQPGLFGLHSAAIIGCPPNLQDPFMIGYCGFCTPPQLASSDTQIASCISKTTHSCQFCLASSQICFYVPQAASLLVGVVLCHTLSVILSPS